MLGLLDVSYVRKEKRKSYLRRPIDFEPLIIDGNSGESWYCFVPSTILNADSLRKNILPLKGKRIIYTTHYVDMIVPSVEQTLENLEFVYENARTRMLRDIDKRMKINLLGVSLGNIFSIKLASEAPGDRIEKLVSLVGGSNLGLSAWHSIATREDSRNSGCATPEEYEEALSLFAPSRYVPELRAEKIFARFGGRDLMIPYNPYGKKLQEDLEFANAYVKDIKAYPLADHCLAIFLSGKENIYDKLK